MIKLIDQRYFLRRNLLTFVGLCLSVYFSWHIVAGERSVLRLHGLEKEVAVYSAEYDELNSQREALESKVVKLRPDSIDRDLLEERVQVVLGYSRPGDRLILYGG